MGRSKNKPFGGGKDASCRTLADNDTIQQALQILKRRYRRGKAITNPAETRQYLQLKLAQLDHEVFSVLYLDNRHRILVFKEMFRGTIDGAPVYPREIVKTALNYNAAAVILVHNHPSGVAEPSQADHALTRRLQDALALVDIRVLDHFIISATETVSLAERGLI